MTQPLILVVEDDASLLKFLSSSLRRHGFQVLPASGGGEGASLARSHNPDLVLLDLGLPDRDGLEVLKDIRGWSEAPVVILSARTRERQKVEALDLGADDYLTKPFGLNELLARIRVALRRTIRQGISQPLAVAGDLRIDLEARRVTRCGEEVHLTPLEYRLLAALVRRNGKVVTHKQLLAEVWGPGQKEQTQYVHIYMGQLRKKLEKDPTRPQHFRTEAGVGYRLDVEVPFA
jgi:two-component system KDP operon response regulator KdpE